MKNYIEMPEVQKCEVAECVYNRGSACHARGITVGDITGHLCDTMIVLGQHTNRTGTAGIGACKAAGCVHNDDFECQAESICIGKPANQAECMTFSAS